MLGRDRHVAEEGTMGTSEIPCDTHADEYDAWVARREHGLVAGAGMGPR
jgi:hypothetical protein